MNPEPNEAPLSVANALGKMRSLNNTQHEVLRFLARSGEPTLVTEIVSGLELRSSTVRDSLAALQEAGLVERTRSHVAGRGRPSWLYQATVLIDSVSLAREFANFTVAAVNQLAKDSPQPDEAARALGAAWGQQIISSQHIPDHGHIDADRAATEDFDVHAAKIRIFLSQLGFEARPGEERNQIDLYQCPFLSVDNQPVPAVCQMHRGMLEHVIGTLSQSRLGVDLAPCAGPGYCQVTLNYQGRELGE